MKSISALSLALLAAMAMFLAGCGGEEGGQQGAFLVTVRGLLADASTRSPVPNAIVTIGSQPAAPSGSDGWFTVPDVEPATNLIFQALHPDYQTLQGVLSLDGTTRTWSLLVAGQDQKQGSLLEGAPGHLTSPSAGQAGALVVDMTAVSGNGGDDLPPPPPF